MAIRTNRILETVQVLGIAKMKLFVILKFLQKV